MRRQSFKNPSSNSNDAMKKKIYKLSLKDTINLSKSSTFGWSGYQSPTARDSSMNNSKENTSVNFNNQLNEKKDLQKINNKKFMKQVDKYSVDGLESKVTQLEKYLKRKQELYQERIAAAKQKLNEQINIQNRLQEQADKIFQDLNQNTKIIKGLLQEKNWEQKQISNFFKSDNYSIKEEILSKNNIYQSYRKKPKLLKKKQPLQETKKGNLSQSAKQSFGKNLQNSWLNINDKLIN